MAEPNKDDKKIELPENWTEMKEVKDLITQATTTAVSNATQGLVTKRDELLDEVKKFKTIAKSFEPVGDPEKAIAALEKVQELEDAELINAKEFDKLFEKKTERMKADHDTQLTSITEKNESLQAEVNIYKGKLGEVTIEGGIRDAAMNVEGSKVYDKAWPDIIARGKRVFTLNDKGEAEPRDINGNIIYGKDAVTPISFKEWAEGLKDDAPHFWEAGSQGGAGTLPNDDASRKGKTLEDQLEEAKKNGDLQLQIRLKRLIANERAKSG